MAETYTLHVAGLTRELTICKVNDHMDIAAFIMLGDAELTVAAAAELLKKCPDFDILLTAEAKGIPLAHEMSRQSGKPYVCARKGEKLYMTDPIQSRPPFLSPFPLSVSAQPIPIAASAAIVAHPLCRRGKKPVGSQNNACFFIFAAAGFRTVRRTGRIPSPARCRASAPAAVPAAGLRCVPASASTRSRGP